LARRPRLTTSDLNVIPAASIERIEILRDGTNGPVRLRRAIAGVINIDAEKKVGRAS
jgi:outer membrane receptor for ferrienterochelin and colicin